MIEDIRKSFDTEVTHKEVLKQISKVEEYSKQMVQEAVDNFTEKIERLEDTLDFKSLIQQRKTDFHFL